MFITRFDLTFWLIKKAVFAFLYFSDQDNKELINNFCAQLEKAKRIILSQQFDAAGCWK